MIRNRKIDVIRGILILSVVFGHSGNPVLHDILFYFHMPLFFVLSGYLLNKEKLVKPGYIKAKSISLLIPYLVYLAIDILLVRRAYNAKALVQAVFGGRYLTGTYWYITCFIFALVIFAICVKYLKPRTVMIVAVICAVAAVAESHLCEHIKFLNSPGVPLNLDVSLLAVFYIAIGFYGKKIIRRLIDEKNYICDLIAIASAAILTAFCIINLSVVKTPFYSFDMKIVYYKELISATVIPLLFGVVICRVSYWIDELKLLCWLSFGLSVIGQITIPIMFIHFPVNFWKASFGYGIWVFALLGVGVPLLITLLLGWFKPARTLLGLPDLTHRKTKS